MPLDRDVKQEIVEQFGRDSADTGSTEVQVALMTQRIRDLTEHMKRHKHDYHSNRGLLRLVGQRRRMLRYLRQTEVERYKTLIKALGLRK